MGEFDLVGKFKNVFRWKPKMTSSYDGGSYGKVFGWTLGVSLIAMVAAYPVSSYMTHNIVDKVQEMPDGPAAPFVEKGGSKAVAMAVMLMDREVHKNDWTPNAPWFDPAYALDNMPNYQKGIHNSVQTFSLLLQNEIGRLRSSSTKDMDLETALSRFSTDPTLWVWNPEISLMPQRSAESLYSEGIDALIRYNDRLTKAGGVEKGKAIYETRADNLMSILDRVKNDLGSVSTNLYKEANDASFIGWLDPEADDQFYYAKGTAYGYCMILKGVEHDFWSVIQDKKVEDLWAKMLSNLCVAAQINPLIVSNSDKEALIAPNHLDVMNTGLLIARQQMHEVHDTIFK